MVGKSLIQVRFPHLSIWLVLFKLHVSYGGAMSSNLYNLSIATIYVPFGPCLVPCLFNSCAWVGGLLLFHVFIPYLFRFFIIQSQLAMSSKPLSTPCFSTHSLTAYRILRGVCWLLVAFPLESCHEILPPHSIFRTKSNGILTFVTFQFLNFGIQIVDKKHSTFMHSLPKN